MSSSYFDELKCVRGIPKRTFELRRRKLLAPFFSCNEIYGSISPCTIFREVV